LKKNSENAKKLISETVRVLPLDSDCSCQHALENAIITDPGAIPQETAAKLEAIVKRHLKF
jgi:hypothetical protein